MNYKVLSNLLFLTFSVFQGAQSKSHGKSALNSLKIVDGKNTTIEQHLYQVALMIQNNTYVCGGTIITPYIILTSAQCVSLTVPISKVRAGSTLWKSGGTLYNVTYQRAHPRFNWDALDFDVGYLRVEKNIILDGKTAKAISLPPLGTSAPIPAGTNVTVTGWGVTKDGYHHASDHLMEVTIPTITNAVCFQEYKKDGEYTITPRMMCAGLPQGGKNACHGDNGGPAVDSSSGVQLGIVSFGVGCGLPQFPIVYTNLTNNDIRGWIKNHTDIYSKRLGLSSFRNIEIVGGKNTTIEEHPYQVALSCPKSRFECGGTIISPRFILTAGHCVRLCSQWSTAHVRVGSTYCNSGGTVFNALRMNLHPNYTWITNDFDLGLIELDGNITLDGKTTKAISLPPLGTSGPIPAGTNVTVTGWGFTKEDEPNFPNYLMEVTVPTISNAECFKEYGDHITSRMLCAGLPEGGKDACHGDSGGPAVDSSSGVQLGVVSFGNGCARAGFAGVYANLTNSDIRNWIRNQTGI